MERMQAALTVHGEAFAFELCGRELNLPPAGRLWYYWLDTRSMRGTRSDGSMRSCTQHWWACMESLGLTDYGHVQCEEDQQQVAANHELMVLAELHAYIGQSKAAHAVFHDAFTRSNGTDDQDTVASGNKGVSRIEADDLVDGDEVHRLRSLAQSRDMAAIGAELREALVGELPPDEDRPACDSALETWVSRGADALQQEGPPGLRRFIEVDLMPWYRRYRRLGNVPQVKAFLNLLAYEAKISFYTCLANAWVDIRAWLRAHRNLDPLSEHLLRLFHNQNPRTCQRGDVFWGQVLSMHPIAGQLMTQPHHMVVLGRYLASLRPLARDVDPDNAENPAYWGFVGATLIACHEYRLKKAQSEQQRGVYTDSNRPIEDGGTTDGGSSSASQILEEYANHIGLRCPQCGGKILRFIAHKVLSFEEQRLELNYRCSGCKGPVHCTATAEKLLRSGRDS